MAASDKKKTETDIPVTFETTIDGVVLGALTQIIETYYYIRSKKKVEFSFHALVITDPAYLAEAQASGRAVNQLILNGSDIETIIPKEDTKGLDLSDCEEVLVKAELSFTESSADEGKQVTDSEVITLIQSVRRSS